MQDPTNFLAISVSSTRCLGASFLPLMDAARETGMCTITFTKASRSCACGPAPAGRDGPRYAILRRGKICWAGVHAQDLRAARHAVAWRLLDTGLHLHRGALRLGGGPAGDGAVRREAGWRDAAGPHFRETRFSGGPLVLISAKQALKTFPPRERSCVEAARECLELGCSVAEADVAAMLSDHGELQ